MNAEQKDEENNQEDNFSLLFKLFFDFFFFNLRLKNILSSKDRNYEFLGQKRSFWRAAEYH